MAKNRPKTRHGHGRRRFIWTVIPFAIPLGNPSRAGWFIGIIIVPVPTSWVKGGRRKAVKWLTKKIK